MLQSECPICYDNTSCYKFFKYDHVQYFDCYLQLEKIFVCINVIHKIKIKLSKRIIYINGN